MHSVRRFQRASVRDTGVLAADRRDRPGPRSRARLRARAASLAAGTPTCRAGASARPRARRGGGEMDLDAIRAGLPVLDRIAYLNAGTNGPLPRRTVEAMQASLARDLKEGRSSREYFEAMLARREELRAALARFLRAPENTIALTTSTTEGCNVVLNGLRIGEGDEVVTTDSEHPGLFGGLVASGADLRIVPVRDIPVSEVAEALGSAITERTKLVALSQVSWLTGALFPMESITGRDVT